MQIVRTVKELRAVQKDWHARGNVIGFVPTMGALHKGHLSLVKAAQAQSDKVIVSIFVNPTQFNDPKDLQAYPRTEQTDLEQLDPLGVDLVYLPSADEMYGQGFATKVSVAGLTDCLCGASRPGHFDGVATVVSKMLLQTGADKAFFGEKDFQQLQVIRRVVADLNIDIDVIGCPTMREHDGLAMSSRNMRLSEEGRRIAPQLHQIMQQSAEAIKGGTPIERAMSTAKSELADAGFGKVDYFEVRELENLELATNLDRPARLFAAVFLEDVRLIDNIQI
ncbi:pantoate--beta-alanine ligase (AMP-forming) [Maritalea myrionectae]|uniref:Pantothenate synthetase n=1 Tax=Maritalea myrionectae TaxID=454601 RepID=A0A2R4MGT7_9HYPH|nr:pantoate--beta-alanine ligase [Maritalea myrionectae]AVX05104.1 pantoate--beta-alanine ligase (AMP-forming) [Maritalea myrionectae]